MNNSKPAATATNAVVVDQEAVTLLDSALFQKNWFIDFEIPENTTGLRRRKIDDVVYLLSDKADFNSSLLIIKVGKDGVFSEAPNKLSLFERILRVALRHFDRNVMLPVQWQPYHQGQLLSVFAQPAFSNKNLHRIYFEQSVNSSSNIYAFALTESPQVLSQVEIDRSLYDAAIDQYDNALLMEPPKVPPVGDFGILLNKNLDQQYGGIGTLADWYNRLLNPEQLRFVKQTYDQPIRLRGAAGTGKTQAMTVKCLHDLYQDHDSGGSKTFAFLTHSSALAHEGVRNMLHSLDPSGKWERLRDPEGKSKLWIGTIYEWAQEQLNYAKKGLRPLSLDGRDGKEYQKIFIEDAIRELLLTPRIQLSLLPKCSDLEKRLKASDSNIVEDIMGEFACVLDAENIQKGSIEADRYISAAREPWQMKLASKEERQILLEIHEIYLRRLQEERFLSMDQMIADFGRYLSTHEWRQLRERDGFDVVFVDEYHYFNRIEAMTLHNLFKSRANKDGRWPLLMAYDLKQSVSDAAYGGGMERFRNPGVGESVPVELKQVYRSTPQIADFLRDLDSAFPALDMEGEFAIYQGRSTMPDGDVPSLQVFNSDSDLVDSVFEDALRMARDLPKGGGDVAVLCLNEYLFDRYRQAGRIQGKFVAITSREDLRELRYAKARCVFSMPEYVAGLQFDTVVLIHADKIDLESENLSQGAQRRYISRVYLGASRAARRLKIASSEERGGPSSILGAPLGNHSLVRM